MSESECPLLGRWIAVEWNKGAEKGGDPDPINDENIILITANSITFPKQPLPCDSQNWTLINGHSAHFTTSDNEMISLNLEGDRLTVVFDYKKPATIIYQRVNAVQTASIEAIKREQSIPTSGSTVNGPWKCAVFIFVCLTVVALSALAMSGSESNYGMYMYPCIHLNLHIFHMNAFQDGAVSEIFGFHQMAQPRSTPLTVFSIETVCLCVYLFRETALCVYLCSDSLRSLWRLPVRYRLL